MSDLTFGPSFKVKCWFTGFGELSFRWIQICIGSPMHRSSSNWTFIALNLPYSKGTLRSNYFGTRYVIEPMIIHLVYVQLHLIVCQLIEITHYKSSH